MNLPLISLITAPLLMSPPSSVLSRAILNIIFCHHLRQAFGTFLPPYSCVLCPPPFFFWTNMYVLKLVDGCSHLSLMPSIICHASRFSTTAFATSSVPHPWFLFLGVPPFPDVLSHSSSATPMNASLYCLRSPSTVPFSASSSSYFLLTLSLHSTIISSLHFHHLILFGPIVLFSVHFFMQTSKTTGLWFMVTYSPNNALHSFTLLSCCCRTTSRSSSVLCCPLL